MGLCQSFKISEESISSFKVLYIETSFRLKYAFSIDFCFFIAFLLISTAWNCTDWIHRIAHKRRWLAKISRTIVTYRSFIEGNRPVLQRTQTCFFLPKVYWSRIDACHSVPYTLISNTDSLRAKKYFKSIFWWQIYNFYYILICSTWLTTGVKNTHILYSIYRFYVASRFALPAQTTLSPFFLSYM